MVRNKSVLKHRGYNEKFLQSYVCFCVPTHHHLILRRALMELTKSKLGVDPQELVIA